MKRQIIIVLLTLIATVGLKAQTPTNVQMETLNDSISVMFQHIAKTNAELDFLNESVRLHSQIALGSFVLEGVGVACLLGSSSSLNNGFSEMEPLAKMGLGLCLAGGIGFICSYIPIWTSKIRLNERGLVIPIN